MDVNEYEIVKKTIDEALDVIHNSRLNGMDVIVIIKSQDKRAVFSEIIEVKRKVK